MAQADRLLDLLALLAGRAHWAAAELAERLEITERTVRRDIARLREIGYPVDAVPGPPGGFGGGRRRPPPAAAARRRRGHGGGHRADRGGRHRVVGVRGCRR